ncbi:hypothetical protein ACN38_g9098 [Penicillium nordicum]|uniref:Uncharacterized protein n=1 Tax=Penicillium nordicum TaxID=229535 RepID=A0A0M8P3Q7_9EURO|nr:hypothetical protein ACN38_g9098 [Penicillium nordicum]
MLQGGQVKKRRIQSSQLAGSRYLDTGNDFPIQLDYQNLAEDPHSLELFFVLSTSTVRSPSSKISVHLR